MKIYHTVTLGDIYYTLRLNEESENARYYADEFVPGNTFTNDDHRAMALDFIENHDMTLPDSDQWEYIVTTFLNV